MMNLRGAAVSRYAFAVLCTALAAGITFLLHNFLTHGIFSFFLIAVIASSWVGGLGPGLVAGTLSILASQYFFFDPVYSLTVNSSDDIAQMIVFWLVAAAISVLQTAQKKARSALQALNDKLEDRVKERTAYLSLVYDITGAANESETVDQAFRYALKRITSEGPWKYSQIYTPLAEDPDALVPSHCQAASEDPRLLKLEDLAPGVRVRGAQGPVGRVRSTGAVEWVSRVDQEPSYQGRSYAEAGLKGAVVFPVIADRKVVAVVECLTDAALVQDPHLSDLMGAVGIELGLIVERKQLQEGYTEAVWQQQRRTAQELHDGLGQRLTGLWLLGTSLSEKLQGTDHSPLAKKLADGIEETVEQIRGLAKGVFPVDLDSEGLMTALKGLTEAMGSASGIACRFECPDPVLLDDNRVAMHLYRIAQEAMTNALKHAKPGAVVVGLHPTEEGVQLRVSDDGAGLPAAGERKEGAGLRIMRYRAAAMDAILTIDSSAGGGTRITCLAPRGPKG